MSLTTRLSAFFLAALALVLAGFSAALYLLASNYLSHQVDERLRAALDVVCTAAEIQPDGVEWEGEDHRPPTGQDEGVDEVRWTVQDERGQVLVPFGRSPNLGATGYLPAPAVAPDGPTAWTAEWQGRQWRFLQRRLLPASQHDGAGQSGKQEGGARRRRYPALVVTTGISLETVEGTLRNLALALVGLSAGVWLAAGALGQRLCRRALRPVTRMAAMARSMTAADLGNRLPCPATGDEVEDLGCAFNELLARVHAAFERQRRFTGDASHQLRTPLTVLLGQVEVALRRERPADSYRETLARVHDQAARLRQIVEMLLFLARADAEARLPNLESVDLAIWLPEQLTQWSGHPRAADIRLDCPAGTALPARIHTPLLGQLLDNLLDNACKHSRPGTPIAVRAAALAGHVELSVEDAGEGIAVEDLPHVFEPFYQARQRRGTGWNGVGLGLAVVARVAAALGGTVDVSSQPDRGSRFTVRLPMREANEPEASATDSPSLTLPAR